MTGPGATVLTIDADQKSRIFHINTKETNAVAVTLFGLTLTGGQVAGDGGAIWSSENLSIVNSTISGNSTAGDRAYGGGIFASSGSITLTNSTVSGNGTTGDNAAVGGIYSRSGSVTLTNSTVSGNSTAGDNATGGGILSLSGSVTLTNSTVSGNSTAGDDAAGGGIWTRTGSLTLTNSTVSGNSTTGYGAHGGGIFVFNSSSDAPLTIVNSIVAGNTVAAGSNGPDLLPDPEGVLTVSHSLIGDNSDNESALPEAQTPDGNGNLIGTDTAKIDPLLGPLAFNGGPTQTHALLSGSPAIDAGKSVLETSVLWQFEEASGTTANDSAGTNESATHFGTTVFEPGANPLTGHGVTFDGVDDYTTTTEPLSSAQLSGNAYSFAFWVRPSDAVGTQSLLAITDADNNHTLLLEYEAGAGGTFRFLNRAPAANSGGHDLRTGTFLPQQWHHVVAVRDGSTMRIYVNGVPVGSRTTSPDSLEDTNWLVTLGRLGHNLNQRYFEGGMDEFAVFNAALTDEDVLQLYTHGLTDQRGGARTIDLPNAANGNGGDGTDIGAVEMVGVSISDDSAAEEDGNLNFTVSLSHTVPVGHSVTVQFDTAVGGTAAVTDDYTAVTAQTVTFTGGGSLTQTVSVPVIDDSIAEGDETFNVVLSNAVGAIITNSTATGTITDDDVATLTVNIAAASISENGGTTTATVSRNTDTTNALTVNLASNDTGEATVPASVTIAAGQITSPAFTITGVDDAIVDGTQTVTVTAAAAAHADGTDTVDVTDDEPVRLDIDHNGAPDAATDGILAIRYLFGFRGSVLIDGAIGVGAGNNNPAEVEAALDASHAMLDADGNGIRDAATDGILILRYLFGFRGSALVNGAIGVGATRTTGAEVAAFLDGFRPPPPEAPQQNSAAAVAAPVLLARTSSTGSERSDGVVPSLPSSITPERQSLFAVLETEPPPFAEADTEDLDETFENSSDWLNLLNL